MLHCERVLALPRWCLHSAGTSQGTPVRDCFPAGVAAKMAATLPGAPRGDLPVPEESSNSWENEHAKCYKVLKIASSPG